MPSSTFRLCRSGLLGSISPLVAMLAIAPAQADPLTVSNAQTTPAATATASNGTPGDITVNSGGSIIVSDVGPAVTVNSNNNLTNNGTIQSSAMSGATAVLVNSSSTPLTTTINNTSVIGVSGAGGSGNYGIRIVGQGVTGSIVSGSSSSLSVLGDNSYGLSVEAPFTGNIAVNSFSVSGTNSIGVSVTAPVTGKLTITGTNGSSGANGTGVLVAAPISGTFDQQGSITGGQASQTVTNADGSTTTVPAAPGIAGVHIAASLGGGFVNDRFFVDSKGNVVADSAATSTDTLIKGTISETVGTPGVLISPLAANGSDVVLSPVGAVGSAEGYGFVNKGTIASSSTDSGLSATGIRIAGASANGLTSNVIVDQGLVNTSTGAVAVTADEGTATGLSIGANTSVPTIVNQGSIDANGSITGAGATASAYAIDIGAGAQVGSIDNSGTIGAQVSSSGFGGPATGIRDQSGSLASITNSGTITATAATGAAARAIDLSAGTAPQTITNSGSITGDILFGSGNGTYASNSGTLNGTLAFGAGSNLLSLDGTTAFASPVTVGGGTLAVNLAGTSSLNLGNTPPVLSSLSATGQSQLAVPVVATGPGLTVTGQASFVDQSHIKLAITQQVGTAPITVLSAGGGITTDHFSTLISGTSTPFLYTLDNYAINGNALEVTLHRKSGLEAGFAPGVAPLFDQSLVAFGNGPTFQAIANLPDQKSLLGAYRQIEPPGFGSMPIRLAQDLQSAGAGVVRGRLDALAAAPPGASGTVDDPARLSPWIEENVSLLRHSDSVADPGFKSNTFDISVGADYALARNLAVGVAGTFAWNDVHLAGMTSLDGHPFSVNSLMADVYGGWNSGPFFVQLVGSFAHNRYNFHRQISIGSISATQVARWNGYQISGDIVGGMRFRFGRWTITPSDAFSYVRLHQSGYQTTGGGDIDLIVQGKNDTATLNTARLGLGYRLPLSEDTALDMAIRAGYIVHLDKHVNPLTAQFTAGGSPFEMSTVAYRGNAFQEGGSVVYEMPGFYLGVTADRSQEKQFNDTSMAVTLRTAF